MTHGLLSGCGGEKWDFWLRRKPLSATAGYAPPPLIITQADILRQAELLRGVREFSARFVSPCIMEEGGKRKDSTDFPRLVKSIVERLQPNVGWWCENVLRNKERDVLAAPLIEQAAAVESEFTLEGWVHEVAKGFSGKRDLLSGFTGTLRVSGNLDPFWPLLVAAGLVHVGLRPHLDQGRCQLLPLIDGCEVKVSLV